MPAYAASRVERLVALDHLRGFIIVLVVLHHAVLAYCTFGHLDHANYALSTAPIVDRARWRGFDITVLLNDAFFMPLLFLLSGLFVPAALARKGTGDFLRGRLLRLGLPFAIAELTIVPLAYYPSFLQAGGTPGFEGFWATTVTVGPWPSGPPWFIAILLLFDVALVLVPRPLLRPLRRAWPDYPTPGRCFAVLLGGSTLLYLPLLLQAGPARWFSFGPVAIQGSRIGLYAAYFAAGAALGAGGNPSLRCFGEAIARRWAGWALLAILTGTTFVLVGAMRSVAFRDLPTWLALGLNGIAVAAFCAAACFALPALFLRFGAGLRESWDSLAANSFAIYLLHYPAVTWLQYGLLSMPVAAWMKGLITFTVALGASWAGAVALRRIPTVGRVV